MHHQHYHQMMSEEMADAIEKAWKKIKSWVDKVFKRR